MKTQTVDSIANAKIANQIVTLDGPCLIRKIFLVFHGTNKTGRTASMADDLAGHLRVNEAGGSGKLGDIVSLVRPQFLMTYWEAVKGWFYEVSVDDGDYLSVLPIPFHIGNHDDNALYIPAGKTLEIQPPTLDAGDLELVNVSCEVVVEITDRDAMKYVPRIFQRRVDLGAVGKEDIAENAGILIYTASSGNDPDRVSIMRGTDRRYYLSVGAGYAIYQTTMHMEAAPTMAGDVVIDFTDMGTDLTELIGGGNEFETLNGTEALNLMSYALDMHQLERMRQSKLYVKSLTAEMAARARQAGISSEAVSAVAQQVTALPGFVEPQAVSPPVRRQINARSPRRRRRWNRPRRDEVGTQFSPTG